MKRALGGDGWWVEWGGRVGVRVGGGNRSIVCSISFQSLPLTLTNISPPSKWLVSDWAVVVS